MRKEFIQCDDLDAAYDAAPWAYLCVEVEGGYQCFESMTGYEIWVNQK